MVADGGDSRRFFPFFRFQPRSYLGRKETRLYCLSLIASINRAKSSEELQKAANPPSLAPSLRPCLSLTLLYSFFLTTHPINPLPFPPSTSAFSLSLSIFSFFSFSRFSLAFSLSRSFLGSEEVEGAGGASQREMEGLAASLRLERVSEKGRKDERGM